MAGDRILIICAAASVRRMWLRALTGSQNLSRERLLFDAVPVVQPHPSVDLAGPLLGGPAAALVAEHFIGRGTGMILLVGTAGALSGEGEALRIGDIVFPRSSIADPATDSVDENLSVEPFELHDPQRSFESFLDATASSEAGLSVHRGGVWSTSSPANETPERNRALSRHGVLAVEMELAAVASVAARKRAALVAGFAISDVAGPGGQRGFRSPQLERALTLLVEAGASMINPGERSSREL